MRIHKHTVDSWKQSSILQFVICLCSFVSRGEFNELNEILVIVFGTTLL